MPAGFPSATNVFLPSHEATGGLMVGYSRNVDEFPLNKYMQIVPVTKDVGAYLVWTSREAARSLSDDGREHKWPDAADAPHGRDELESFRYEKYMTQRYMYSFAIGDKTVKQADWPILRANSKAQAQKAMTERTRIALAALSSYSFGTHEVGINGSGEIAASGKGWDNGTSDNPIIMDSLNYAAQLIHKDSIGAIKPEDLILVIGPALARKMAKSPEIHSYLKESPFAKGRLGIGGNNELFSNSKWGLPEVVYGYTIVVEDTPHVGTPKGNATQTPQYLLGDDVAYFLARPGGLEGLEGSPMYSTLTGFFFEEFTVEMKQDPDNRRTQGRIVTDFEIQVVADYSACKFVNVLSDDSSGA